MAKKFSELLGVMDVVMEVLKVPCKNKTIFLFIILSTMIPTCLLILANTYSIASFTDMVSTDVIPLVSMVPTCPEYPIQISKIKEDFMLFIIEVMIFLFLVTVVTSVSMVATIYVSAMSYLGKDLPLKDLVLKIRIIWIRPGITWFFVSLMIAGFTLLVLPLFVTVVLERESIIVVTVGTILILLAIVLNMYLVLVWMLSLVISVLEDCYGLHALGKAEKLINGRKVVGLVITFVLMLLINVTFLLPMINKNHQTIPTPNLMTYVTINLAILVKILSMMMYTVFYFNCKHSHGEHVEVEDDMEYSSVSTIALDV